MKICLLIGLAGFAGTLCRYGVTCLPWPTSTPCGTLAVNLIGAFSAGFCYVWLRARYPEYASYFPVLFIGFFGAFTTFSTFALESSRLLSSGRYGAFLLNVSLQNLLGVGFAYGGLRLARRLFE